MSWIFPVSRTAAPTTAPPTTLTTAAPTTLLTTAAPTTAAGTTGAPTTAAPTTIVTTAAPTTLAPTTAAPTTTAFTQYHMDLLADNVTVTGDSSGDTKGAWAEIIASTANSYEQLIVMIHDLGVSSVSFMVDIGTGNAGSESVVVENIAYRETGPDSGITDPIHLSINITSGTRIAARCQSADGGSDTLQVSVWGVRSGGNLNAYNTAETLGADDTTTTLTEIDPGGTADTKSAWVELGTASFEYGMLVLMFLEDTFSLTTCQWSLDLGVGDAGSEEVVIEDLLLMTHSNHDKIYPMFFCVQVNIPNGARVAVRASCTITDATDRLLHVGLIGVG